MRDTARIEAALRASFIFPLLGPAERLSFIQSGKSRRFESGQPIFSMGEPGTSMMLRESTDHRSPLAVERFSAGFRVPLLTSSSGRVYLAFSPPTQRDSLLEILARSNREEDKLARNRPEVMKLLNDVKMQGYASAVRPRRVSEEISLSVPILIDDRVLAAVMIRFSGTAVPLKLAVDRFLPKLRDTAQKIRQTFLDQQRDAPQRAAAPQQTQRPFLIVSR